VDLGDQVSAFEVEFRELVTKWERFFSGDLKQPPMVERTTLERRLRMAYERPGNPRRVDQFRLENLQHRFMTYGQNWERMLREREEGRGRTIVGARPKSAPPPPPDRPNAPAAGAVHAGGGDSLFEQYQAAKASLGQAFATDRQAFEAKIAAQREALEARLGSGVTFEVKVEDGKVKLAARKAGKGQD
jgi:hypothetical protein